MGKETKVCLAFLWHQHQPYYRELSSNELVMPWARLHAVKDYYDMPKRLERFPEVHQTFNLVPSLVRQVEDYSEGTITDRYFEASKVPVEDLTPETKRFIVERFFDIAEGTMVAPYRRYQDLKQMKDGLGVVKAIAAFEAQDLLDLQVWFNLAWIDPGTRENDAFLHGLEKKGKRFSEEEKSVLLGKHREIMKQVVPVHRDLQNRGIIEVTTTPFFHPILPLLCDTDEAKVALPEIRLPVNRFRRPEDAREQVRRSMEFYEKRFGKAPRGMWPAEGSVSPEAAALFAEAGVEWIAADEEVLACSLGAKIERGADGIVGSPEVLYRPYEFETSAGPIRMLFRDHCLSDMIGFQYQGSDPGDAVDDFISRLEKIVERIPKGCKTPPIVSVILDGENCWEFYPNDGNDFLDGLCERLSEHKTIRCVTVSEYLDEYGSEKEATSKLPKLHSGSWINHNFRIWIGHAEDNQAWDYLHEARRNLVEAGKSGKVSQENLDKAWEELYIAEGSDWNWWYGDDHHSDYAEVFDELYRKHLQNIYSFIDREAPGSLFFPIAHAAEVTLVQQPLRMIAPTIDGRSDVFFEWYGAGRFDAGAAGGAMHRADSRVHCIYFGFDVENMYFRLDFASPLAHLRPGESCSVVFVGKESVRATLRVTSDGTDTRLEIQGPGGLQTMDVSPKGAMSTVLEMAVPWTALPEVEEDGHVSFLMVIRSGNIEIERVPQRAVITTVRPGSDFDEQMWYV